MRPWFPLLTFVLAPLCPLRAVVYTTYHWHQQQPIYWPQPSSVGPPAVETAWESVQRRVAGAAHPENDVAQIFSLADRQAAYQWRMRDAVASMSGARSGAQASYAGCLIDNVASLGAHNALGYTPAWNQAIRQARGWLGPGGHSRLDMLLTPYHHSIAPLLDEEALRMEIRIAKLAHSRAWGADPGLSTGFFPPEMCFSERLIPVLAEEGIQWSYVPNNHLSRACANFPLVLGTGGENCDPPNRADQINPAQSTWWSRTISRGCTPTNAAPFAMRPHKAQWIDPDTGLASTLTVVPMEMAMSWQDGYQMYGLEDISQVAATSEAAQPLLIVLGHDGDNAWGGGYSYYMESVPSFTSQAVAAGHVPTTVRQYLTDHPVSASDLVHVEDGGWVNADGDFGSPDFINWNWPLTGPDGFDIAGGWAEDERNWALITAAQNRVLHAADMDGAVDPASVMDPVAYPASPAELAWHHFLPSLESGYMYYGTALDMEVKPTVACNTAINYANQVIGAGLVDLTPPTVWIPQQLPHNPGETGFGSLWGYQATPHDRDFWVWTFAYDVSGIDSVRFRYRVDVDGMNPLSSNQNETWAGGSEVGAWRSLSMNRRVFPTGNVYGDPGINFFVTPSAMADEYWIHVQEPELVDAGGVLVDYFVEAVDARGLVKRSPIQHTWIGTGSGSGGGVGGERVSWWPQAAQAGEPITLQYRLEGGPLPSATDPVWLHWGSNGWSGVSDLAMAWAADSSAWRVSFTLPAGASSLDFVFTDLQGHWDNNGGLDWHVPVAGAMVDWAMDGQLDAGAHQVASSGDLVLWAGWNGSRFYVAATPAQNARDHFIFLAGQPGPLQAAPWAKAGQVADWSAYLANEVGNGWAGWFEAAGGAPTLARGAVLEGSLDPAALLGGTPDTLWLALGAWATPDGGALLGQAPAGDGDGLLEVGEWVSFSLAPPDYPAVEDLRIERLSDGGVSLAWSPPQPPTGWQLESYTVLAATNGGIWQDLVQLGGGIHSWVDSQASAQVRRSYRVRVRYSRL